MIEIKNVCVEGWEAAICVGANDLNLMKKLSAAGTDHSKFMRMINVTCDIIAPLYWWKEFDTYKVGTVANSCSTMHKIHEKEFTLDDFSLECVTEIFGEHPNLTIAEGVVNLCENYRTEYLRTNDKRVWKALIQLLPSSYNQRRTVQLNYAVLKNMYHARKNHKLDEWIKFCDWIEQLPYADELLQTRLNNGQIV